MAILPIITGKDTEVLRTKTQKVPKATKEIKKLIRDMQDPVQKAEGLGLAAPQVNRSFRLCLAQFNGKMTPLINPEITWRSDETSVMEEGCLSLPGINKDVERSTEITVTYLDENGNEQERRLHDLDARVVQHEVDHLDGVLIVDYAPTG